MPDIQKMLEAAGSVKRYCDTFILRAKVNDSEVARAAAHLCLTIAEQFDATTCLIENKMSSHSPIIVRSMLEGMADLYILVEDATHFDQMAYDSARTGAKTYEKMASFAEVQNDKSAFASINAAAAMCARERDRLHAEGYRPQKIENKLTKAGLGDSYASYQLLCGYAHNDLQTLHVRHHGPSLRYHHEADPSVITGMLHIAVRLLTEAVILLPQFTNIHAGELAEARAQVDRQWAAASA
jgi:hypothetical protein